MNPHQAERVSPASLLGSLYTHRRLILRLTQRDISGRYRGSAMGLAWSFVTPILMLAVYTFVFSVVFQSRWGEGLAEGKTHFAIVLFVGMIVHSMFAEVINRAPTLIPSNINFVKKVVFPLEILPVVVSGTSLFHAGVNIMVLLAAVLVSNGGIPWSAIFIVPVLAPLLILTLGLSWALASLGVYLRDVSQITAVVTTILLFLSPVFFPLSAVPESFQVVMQMNPLTFIINQAREVLIWGRMPDWAGLGIYAAAAATLAWIGFIWFQKTRKGFADVL